jgi:predicted nucleic acid-binding protein
VIYLDSSVALAHLFGEGRSPPAALWRETVSSSRLLEYEVWNCVHARGLTHSHADEARALLGQVALIELTPPILARALEPFPTSVRILDALHLASMAYLREQGQEIALASFDKGLNAGARALGIPLYAL